MQIWQAILELSVGIQFFLLCSVYYLLKYALFVLPNRALRTIKVCSKGWPPAHLDADGDWKPEPKSDLNGPVAQLVRAGSL